MKKKILFLLILVFILFALHASLEETPTNNNQRPSLLERSLKAIILPVVILIILVLLFLKSCKESDKEEKPRYKVIKEGSDEK